MQFKKLRFCAFLLAASALSELKAQNTVLPSGGNVSGSGGTVSYSIGQIAYTKNSGPQGASLQGVQQPYETSVISGLEEARINLVAFVYPNPSVDLMILQIESDDRKNLTYCLLDIKGNQLESHPIKSPETQVNLSSLTAATYTLTVMQNNKELKSFKIIKY